MIEKRSLLTLITLNDPDGRATKFLDATTARIRELELTLQNLLAPNDNKESSVEGEVTQIEGVGDEVEEEEEEKPDETWSLPCFAFINSKYPLNEPLIVRHLSIFEENLHQFIEFFKAKNGNYKKICSHHEAYTEVWADELSKFKPFFLNQFYQEYRNIGQVVWNRKPIIIRYNSS